MLFAGQLINQLKAEYIIKGDTSLLASNLHSNLSEKPIEHLKKLAHSQILSGRNRPEDIDLCLIENQADII